MNHSHVIPNVSYDFLSFVKHKGAPVDRVPIVLADNSFILFDVVFIKADQKSWSDDAKLMRQFFYAQLILLHYIDRSGSLPDV